MNPSCRQNKPSPSRLLRRTRDILSVRASLSLFSPTAHHGIATDGWRVHVMREQSCNCGTARDKHGGNGVLEGAEGIDCLFLAKPWVSVLRVARL